VISRKRLKDFWDKHPDAETELRAWHNLLESRVFMTPHELREDYASASFLGDHRTVFNICGNKYRLVVDMRYDLGRVYIRHVLTHKEYDKRIRDRSL
jgi:mRNA interferase HigB